MPNTTTIRRSSAPIKWHGGKHYLAARIIEMLPPHIHYIEPYFGGGAVFFRKPYELIEGHSEVINDRFGALINFWTVLKSEELFPQFVDRVRCTPFAKPVWEQACRSKTADALQQAVDFFIRFRQSRQGLGTDFATLSRKRTRRGMNEQVSSWLSAIEGLEDAHQRLSRVVIFNEHAPKIILQEDDTETCFYCDPPYVSSTRTANKAYACEMNDVEHQELLDVLSGIQGKFLLSGYRNALYDQAAKSHGWNRVDIEIDNKASSQKTKPRKTECLWFNY